MYWGLAILLLTLSIYFIIINWIIFVLQLMKKKTASWIPFLGGFLGVLGLMMLPVEGALELWWVPLVIDYGCLLGMGHTAFYYLFLHKKKK